MFDQARPSNAGYWVVRGMLMTAWQLVTDLGFAPTLFLLFGGYGSADCKEAPFSWSWEKSASSKLSSLFYISIPGRSKIYSHTNVVLIRICLCHCIRLLYLLYESMSDLPRRWKRLKNLNFFNTEKFPLRLSVPLIRFPALQDTVSTHTPLQTPPPPPCPKLLNEEEAGEASPCGSYLLHDRQKVSHQW